MNGPPVTAMTVELECEPFAALALHRRLVADLRSDHAGETGAVMIYRGILAVSRDPAIRAFALEHLETERRHLDFFERWLPDRAKSRLLPLWRLLGSLTGRIAALGGRRWVYATIEAVETFVVEHYAAQLATLDVMPYPGLKARLASFCTDEDAHRRDALSRGNARLSGLLEVWVWLVRLGSKWGVAAARVV